MGFLIPHWQGSSPPPLTNFTNMKINYTIKKFPLSKYEEALEKFLLANDWVSVSRQHHSQGYMPEPYTIWEHSSKKRLCTSQLRLGISTNEVYLYSMHLLYQLEEKIKDYTG